MEEANKENTKEVSVKAKSNPVLSNLDKNNAEINNNKDLPDRITPEENTAKESTAKENSDDSNTAEVKTIDEVFYIIKNINSIGIEFFDNEENKKLAVRLEELLKKWRAPDQAPSSIQKGPTNQNIKRQSEQFRNAHTELIECFQSWKSCRERLIGIMKSSPNILRKISNFVSGFRIFTSAADILGTTAKSFGNESWYSTFAMENASMCALVAVFLEQIYVEKLNYDIKTISGEDKQLLEKLIKCFNHLKKIDEDIKNFFPKGINKNIVKTLSKLKFHDTTKMFLAIVFSNGIDDAETLQQSKDLLKKAKGISAAEAGLWLKKVVFSNDPYAHHCLNSELCCRIQENLEKMSRQSKENSSNKEARAEVGCRISWEGKLKMLLNAITIVLAIKNIMSQEESEIVKNFEKIANDGGTQLGKIEKIVLAIKPPDAEIDIT